MKVVTSTKPLFDGRGPEIFEAHVESNHPSDLEMQLQRSHVFWTEILVSQPCENRSAARGAMYTGGERRGANLKKNSRLPKPQCVGRRNTNRISWLGLLFCREDAAAVARRVFVAFRHRCQEGGREGERLLPLIVMDPLGALSHCADSCVAVSGLPHSGGLGCAADSAV